MSDVDWIGSRALHRPIMVVAFEGWFDAGDAATAAIEWLKECHGSYPLATIDPETYFDFQQARPTVTIDERGERSIAWPSNPCEACRVFESTHDLVMCSGIEPHLRWRTFTENLLEVASGVGTEMVVTLGATYDTVPHTRPFGVVGSTSNRDLAERLGVGQPSYQGPTGVIGTLHDTLDRAGLPVISLRVSVPHYVQGGVNPKATQSLLRRFELVTGTVANPAGLDTEVVEWEERVSSAVLEDPDVAAYVRQLEGQFDTDPEPVAGSGDLAAEIEAFLRERHDED